MVEINYKDNVIKGIIPEVVSECGLMRKGPSNNTCFSNEAVAILASKAGISDTGNVAKNIEKVRNTFGVTDDRELLSYLPDNTAKKEIKNFKLTGPSGVQLLSNVDIDGILAQWAIAYPNFYAYTFNMIDYTSYSFRDGRVINEPDTLATIDPVKVFSKHDCCGCIINSDKYHGSGKHWMALFADIRDRSNPTVEFFNSSGREPAPEWISWMNRAALAIESVIKKRPRIVTYNRVHQYSMTECGVYSLFYIYARLVNVPVTYFKSHVIKDELMFEFRAHLFTGYMNKDQKMFSITEFEKNTRIQWDSSDGHREGDK